ncbi:MAG: response regulator, partial [Oscillospiraceae bacterium]
MSVKIAVCDDSEQFNKSLCDEISAHFSDEGVETSLYVFTNPFELLEQSTSVAFDILFLDIDMPAIDGIKTAERLRQQNDYITIIFITNRDDLVFEAIKFKPFRFIRKERLEDELDEAFKALISSIKTKSLTREFSVSNGTVSL